MQIGFNLPVSTATNTVGDIAAVKAIGVTAIDFGFEGRDPTKSANDMNKFRDEVLSRI